MKTAAVLLFVSTAASAAFATCSTSEKTAPVYQRAMDSQLPSATRRDAFEIAVRSCPDDATLYAAYASFLVASRDFRNALSAADYGLMLTPRSDVLHLRRGEALIALGEGTKGLAALEKTPTTAESQFFRGLGFQLLADHARARDSFLDAWKRGNDDPYLLYCLIREDEELNDKAAGLEHFRLLITRFPSSTWVHVLLGDAHFQKGEETLATDEYRQALTLSPDQFEANFRLAYLAFEAGQNESAIRYYRAALAAKPHHTEANVYLGEALRRDGRLHEAIEQLKEAVAIDPTSVLAYDSLAKALSDAGRATEAASVLNDAEMRFPENSNFPAMRSRILTRLGRVEEARRDASKAAALIAHKNRNADLVQQ